MKFTTSTIIISLLAASTQAWELTVWLTDGRHVTTHGTKNSGCVTYDFASEYIRLPKGPKQATDFLLSDPRRQ